MKEASPTVDCLKTPNVITDPGPCPSSSPSLIEFLDKKSVDKISIISDDMTKLHTEQNEQYRSDPASLDHPRSVIQTSKY